jgi:hypothetical protein
MMIEMRGDTASLDFKEWVFEVSGLQSTRQLLQAV